MSFIYKITSPSNKVYIGQSTVAVDLKIQSYKSIQNSKAVHSRKIINSIQKYKWENMKFEIIEENINWSKKQLNDKEIFWISHFNSVKLGYNMTLGGDGIDPNSARANALKHHASMSQEMKIKRSNNCSIGQQLRYKKSSDNAVTRQRKKESQCGHYLIESPDGTQWETTLGLKEFANKFKDEINVGYWTLFHAYRRHYNNHVNTSQYKTANLWKVIRVDR